MQNKKEGNYWCFVFFALSSRGCGGGVGEVCNNQFQPNFLQVRYRGGAVNVFKKKYQGVLERLIFRRVCVPESASFLSFITWDG